MNDISKVKNSLTLNIGIGITFSVIAGFILASIYCIIDEMIIAYFSANNYDIASSYLQAIANRLIFSFVALFAFVELVLYLFTKNQSKERGPIISITRFVLISMLIFFVSIYSLIDLYWFPKILTRQGAIYSFMVIFTSAVISIFYLKYRSSKLRHGSLARCKFSFVIIALLIFINSYAFIQKRNRSDENTNIIVIVIDALRNDHLGCYGYKLPTSPNIDKFAKESVLFTKSYSQSTHTKPSTASLFTSLYPSQHNVVFGNRRDAEGNYISDRLDPSLKTMAEYLNEAGFNTAGFLEQGQIHDYMGFAQGFNYYNSYLKQSRQINQQLFRWLPENKHRKFFAYIHYLDVHAPYAPPPKYKDMFVKNSGSIKFPEDVMDWRKFKNRFDEFKDDLTQADIEHLIALYDAEIRALDHDLGLLFDQLKKEGVYDKSLIILTADHGESFMEHDEIDHGSTMYEEVLRIPMIVRFPNAENKGLRDIPVQTIDVLPSILDYLKIKSEQNILMGQSFLSTHNETNGNAPRTLFHERLTLQAIRKGKLKYIYDDTKKYGELYDLENDPTEQINLVTQSKYSKDAESLHNELINWAETVKKFSITAKGVKVDEKTVEKLKSLGYIK